MSLILWAALGVIAMLMDAPGMAHGHDRAQGMVAALTLGLGVWIFWRHGGHQITAAGIFCLATAMFVGFAGLWWLARPGPVDDAAFYGTAAGYWTMLAMYGLFWRDPGTFAPWSRPDPAVTAWGMRVGVIATVLAVAAGVAGIGSLGQFMIGGLALFIVSAMLHRADRGQLPLRAAVALGGVALYWQVAFDGFGRLSVASLCLVGVVVGSGLSGRRTVKAVVLVALAPVTAYLVSIRNDIGSGAGIGSLVNPVHDFGRLVGAQERGLFDLAHGETFVASLLFWVPRAVWADKPEGFGRELVAILEPQLLATNHSMAALSLGEWFYNFGWVGLVAMVLAVGWFLRALDSGFARCTHRDVDSRRALLATVIVVVLAANVANLVWVGTFTYLARAGQQLLVAVGVALWTATRREKLPAASRRRPVARV